MYSLTQFDEEGRITGVLESSDETQIQANIIDGFGVSGVYSADTHYYDKSVGLVVSRPQQKTLLNDNHLIKLPEPCVIYINNMPYQCTESVAELSFDQPGTYKIRVESFPYLDKEFVYENYA